MSTGSLRSMGPPESLGSTGPPGSMGPVRPHGSTRSLGLMWIMGSPEPTWLTGTTVFVGETGQLGKHGNWCQRAPQVPQ